MRSYIVLIFQFLSLAGWAQPVLVPFKTKAGKWQLVEKYTASKVLGDYDRIEYLQEGIYEVWKNGKAGLVHMSGRQLLPVEYKPVSNIIKFSEGMYPMEKDGKITWFTDKGEVAYDWSFIVGPEFFGYYTKGLLRTLCGGGYLDKKGRLAIRPLAHWYDYEKFTDNGLAKVTIRTSEPPDTIWVDHGVIDTTGKLIIPIKYDLVFIKDDYVEAFDMLSNETGIYDYDYYTLSGVKFLSGRYSFPEVYYKAGLFSYWKESDHTYSLRTLGDHREISDQFGDIREFPGSRVLAYADSATFLVNRQGEITKLFDQRIRIDTDRFGRYFMKRDNRTCAYDSSDHELFCFSGDTVLRFGYPDDTKEGFKIYDIKAKKEGYINKRGEMLVPCIYDGVWYYPELGIWLVKEGDNHYYIDEKRNRYIEQ
jgi:hypothetical protein